MSDSLAISKNKKTLVIDTSVLLYDKNSLLNMGNNNIVIPLVVLEEIDNFKTKEGILGEYARYINRFLDDLRIDIKPLRRLIIMVLILFIIIYTLPIKILNIDILFY